MAVDSVHFQYQAMLPAWQLCRDVSAGARAVKEKGAVYLPRPAGMSHEDYRSYLGRAVLFSAMNRTLQALSGTVFVRPPVVEVPRGLRDHLEDVTLRGESLTDVALQIVIEILQGVTRNAWSGVCFTRDRKRDEASESNQSTRSRHVHLESRAPGLNLSSQRTSRAL